MKAVGMRWWQDASRILMLRSLFVFMLDFLRSDCVVFSYVLHLASPFIIDEPEDENVLIKPAVDGTLNVLKYGHRGRNREGV